MTVGYQRNLVVSRSRAWNQWIEQRLPVARSRRVRLRQLIQSVVTEIASLQTAVATRHFPEREWRSNLFRNSRFAEGWRKGVSVGGAVRWWGPANTRNGGIMLPGLANPVVDQRIFRRHARQVLWIR